MYSPIWLLSLQSHRLPFSKFDIITNELPMNFPNRVPNLWNARRLKQFDTNYSLLALTIRSLYKESDSIGNREIVEGFNLNGFGSTKRSGTMGKHTLIKAAVLLLLCSSCVGLVWADCDTSSEITKLNPCLSVTTGSDAAPSQSCCAAIKSLVAEGPCLCERLAYAETATLPFNLTSLLSTVPAICNVDTSTAGCSASSPAGSPASSSLPFMLPFPIPSGPVPAPLSSVLPRSGASRKIPGTILSILQFASAPALLSLVLRAY